MGLCFSGVSTAKRAYQFKTLSDGGQVDPTIASGYIGELTTLRSFFYWQLVDLYGNIPYDNDFANALAAPPQVPRATVYSNVVADLEAAVPTLSQTVDGTTYARMNYWAGKFLLAKLYLNAQGLSGVNGVGGTIQWTKRSLNVMRDYEFGHILSGIQLFCQLQHQQFPDPKKLSLPYPTTR